MHFNSNVRNIVLEIYLKKKMFKMNSEKCDVAFSIRLYYMIELNKNAVFIKTYSVIKCISLLMWKR